MTEPEKHPSTLEITTEEDIAPDGTLMLEPRELFDPAFIGVCRRAGEICALYSESKVIAAMLADQPDADPDEIVEHYHFNVSGGAGWGLPMFMQDDEELDDDA